MWLLYMMSIKVLNYKWHAKTVWKKNTITVIIWNNTFEKTITQRLSVRQTTFFSK